MLSLPSSGKFRCLLSGKPSFTKKQADLFFPPDFADDFPVSMQVYKCKLHIGFSIPSRYYVKYLTCFDWADFK